MAEQTFYDKDGIQVTNARLIVGNATFQLSQINQVVSLAMPASKAGPVWMIVLGSIILVVGLAFISSSIATFVIVGLIGLSMVVGAILMLVFGFKPSYAVRVTTSSGQKNALIDKHKAYIDNVVKALNDAMASKT